MNGNSGDDWYFVDDPSDYVVAEIRESRCARPCVRIRGLHAPMRNRSSSSRLPTMAAPPRSISPATSCQQIFGNNGSNALKGGLGNDTLVGLGGADAFVFNTALNSATNVDRSPTSRRPPMTRSVARHLYGHRARHARRLRLRHRHGRARCRRPHHLQQRHRRAALRSGRHRGRRLGAVRHVTPGLALTNADFIVV